MKDSGIINSYIEQLFSEFSHPNQENSPCHGIENVSIIVNKKRWKKRKKHNVFDHAQQPPIAFRLSKLSKPNKPNLISRHSSMPELKKCTRLVPLRNRSGHGNDTRNKFKQSPFQSKFIANVVSEHRFDSWFLNPFDYPSQTKWKIYRCQLGAVEDSCCCSCNSDAMFEVMKGLYDCYKAKNCDGCDCVLCGYKTKEEKKLAELRKSMTSAAREKVLEGKTPEEKEFILKEMAKSRQPLPSGKTASEKALIDKTRKELGLPPTPKTLSEKTKMRKAEAAGIITPLEGKTPEEKEKILRAQAAMGLPLPEGRTDSEKALIDKIKASKKLSIKTALLTPLTGKTPGEKEKILRGRAMKGLPLPEAQSPSEKKLIDKVRADLGLPKDPTTKSMKEKHEQAAKAGLLQPLEGKTPLEKEKTLKGLRDLGIPLPEGRTPSEKALIAKVKASPRSLVAPSEQMRRAKVEGLLTPLAGKTPEQKEKILKGLAMKGLPLPEATSPSEKKLIDKVRVDLGLPKEPDTKSMKTKYEEAAKAGLLQPMEGKTPEEKEKTLKGLHDLGIPLPEGRTPSEKVLVAKIKSSPRAGSIKTAGLMTTLTGKAPALKEKILRARAMKGIPLPEGTTPSEKKIIDKVRADLGLPKEPDTKSMKAKHEQAAKAGLLEPLEGKTPAQKEAQLKGLRDMGIPLPEGRTPSEKALIAKVKGAPRSLVAPSEQLRRAKAEGLMTPLTGKTPAQKEKILKGLAMKGLPLPEAKSPSEKKLIDKVRDDLGLPKEPDTKSMKDKYEQAAKAGLLQPLVGKTPEEKEKILQGQHDFGIPLPEGRTPSEKALIAKIKAAPPAGSIKTAGIMTPLAGKAPALKEKVLRARAKKGIPLPEGTSPSEKKIIDKVRADLGLPKEPDTKSMKVKHEQAAKAGLLEPLEGKTPAQKEAQLKGLRDMGIPLPEGRTPSEKALIAKVKGAPRSLVAPSEQLRRAKAEGLMTPLTGKTPAQKEKILKGLAMKGLPLPEGKSPSEKRLIDKVRDDLGLPKEPDTKSMKDKYEQAAKAGLLQPLVGKTPKEKEKILQGQHDLGIPLPEGRTPSEKALIAKIKATPPAGSIKTAGIMTPLAGKTPALKEKVLRARAKKGIPLPEGTTPSEKKIIDKVRADLGLPKEPDTKSMKVKHEQAAKAGLLEPLEGKTPAQKEAQLKGLRDMGIPLPEGRTPSEKALIAKVKGTPRSLLAPSEQLRRAKAEGLMTPLTGKTPAQKEKILKGLAMKGLPLPEGKSPSEKKLINKVRDDLGLPKEPDTKSMKDKYEQAAKAGLLQPLVGKTPEEKEKILQGQHDFGIPLPEGRTPSEKALIAKIKAAPPAGSIKTTGIMTPLAGKAPALKEKVLRARAKKGIPLPEGTTPSEKKIIDKVRADLGLPKEPDTKSMKAKHEQAAKAGLLEPLEGKTPAQKEAQLKGLRDMGIPLPEGRTPSEKALIAKVKGAPRSLVAPSEQMRRAKVEGLLTPLTGKTPAQKEKILKGLAMKGIPLPEGKSPSEKKLIDKVRDDLGLPKEPDTKSMKDKYEQAAKAGLLQPLVGKTPKEKEKILQGQHDLGIPLPEGRTPSEKALIAKIKAAPPAGSIKTAGLMTPLAGKAPALKEKVLRARAKKGIPLPEGSTPSEKKIIDKVRADLGLPKEPDTKSMKAKHEQAAKAGLLEPLEGKTPAQKEAQLKGLRDMGIPLPEGRTPSEKALIAKVKGAPRSLVAPSEQLRRAKAEGLMTPLTGKTPAQKEKILKGLAMKGLPLPEAKSPSEKKLIDKVRDDLGLPKEPDTKSMKDKYEQAAKAGLLQPLVGKTPEEKEKILQGQHDLGILLPEGRTPSEKALIAKIKAAPPAGSIKTAGIMTPLAGKAPALKEKVLRARAKKGIPLPEGTTPSEKKIIDKVRADLGLPKEPDTKSMKAKHEQAAKAGLLEPLEGKTPAQKEAQLKGLRDMGIPLPEGRTPSEKAIIAKVKGAPRSLVAPSEQLRRAKAEGLMTPLTGKTPAQKEKILKGLAMKGLPLPEGKSPSEKKLIDKVRDDLGLPKEPDTKSMKDKYEQAAKAGLLQPLVGKTPEEKEKILQGQHDLGIPLPEGRTPSEKALIAKIKASPPAGSIKTAGLMTPLSGKSPALKEKVLRARAKKGIPLPEGTTPSEKKIIDKVRADLGLPKEPDTKSMKAKHEQAAKAGLLEPLEGKTPAQKEAQLKGLRDMGIPLPEGRTPSEKALIAKVKGAPRSLVAPSEQLRRAKAEGLMTPLTGKTPTQKEKILKGLAMKGIPLPEGKSPSEKILIDKVRDDLGLPKEPDTKSMKDKHEQAAKAGFLQPLVGKTPEEKEKILQGQHDLGIPLPEGRTPSEKALIAKIKAAPPAGSIKTAGIMTPLAGKAPALKEKVLRARAKKGIPLPEGTTPSEKKIIDKVRADLGLPKEPDTKSMKAKHEQAAKAGLLEPLEGKTPAQKEAQLKGLRDMGIPLPEGRTPSEKALIAKVKGAPRSLVAPSEQLRRAKAEGLMTPLTGKTPAQKEKILKGLAMKGLPLPEAKSPSEKKLIDKVRDDLGLPKEPDTKSMKDKYEQAAKAGLLQPLVGKTPEEKEKILQGQHDLGIPLPEGRTPSEKALIAKIKAVPPAGSIKTAGLMTPLAGKAPALKEKVLKARAMKGIPLPEGTTPSEKKIIDKVRADLGLPKEPDTKSMKAKHEQAAKAGLLEPLEGKTPAQKEAQLKGLRDMGIPLPEGRTPSEKALIAKVKEAPRSLVAPSEQLRRAKAEGLMTPLTGKTPAQKEKILKGLAMKGIPLPEGKSPSEKILIEKVRDDLGLPKEPDTKSMKDKHEQAAKAGFLQPLVGKTPEEKEKILQGQHDLGIPLPEGRTPSEKALIAKIKAAPPAGSIKTAGIMTPLAGKAPALKEKVLRARAMKGIPLPEGTTPSEKKIIDKVRADLGLPKEPDTKSMKAKHEQAAKAGLLEPLEGKTPAQKEAQLKGLRDMGIPLPEGRTPSEKALIAKVQAAPRSIVAPSEQMRRAKAEGLMTPLTGKTPAQKEKILKGLAMKGIPLPEGKSPSEKKLIDKVRDDLGLPKEPDTKSMKDKYEKAAKAGYIQPLVGKTPEEKEKILQGQHDMGIPLPEGRTPSEKALIAKVKAGQRAAVAPSEQMRRAKAEGLLSPLKGKTPEQKEKILKGLAMKGIPLPEPQTPSEKKLVDKVRADLGLPKEPTTKALRDKYEEAAKAGLLQPLEGKTPEEKEKTLKGLAELGIPLPEGRTPSEKALVAKVKASTKKAESVPTITTEKIRKAKEAGLLTPLAGKTPEQKEKLLQGLAKTGLPLPEGKTPSEKALINKVKKEFGIPDRTPSEKLRRAKAAGLLTPLEGKTPAQKEKILRGRAAAGLPLPMDKTPSERALIKKIKEETGYVTPSPSERIRKAKAAGIITTLKGKSPSMKAKILQGMKAAGVPIPEGETLSEKKLISKLISAPKVDLEGVPSDKIRAAKAAGLLTPLEGKTSAQKEKIIKGLAEAGLPIPEGKTKSEKSMIAKIKARTPPEGKTPSEKAIIGKAKAAGLFTPITGKSPAEKERILKGLAEAGLPLPEGKTASEKELVKKIRAEAGLPLEPTPSEKKGKIIKKAKKVGVSASKRAAGIDAEEFEDIIKTTKCDRGCGCDRKKIRFKHSYVKIRVTSPDISSFCDCPGECFPQVKNGAFIDNDGIKVTVGSAVGIPSYSMVCINQVTPDKIVSNTDHSKTHTNYNNNVNILKNSKLKFDSFNPDLNNNSNKANDNLTVSSSENNYDLSKIARYQGRTSKSDRIVESLKDLQLFEDIYKEPISKTISASSFDTILIIRNDMSLSTSTSNSMDTISLTSVLDSSITSSSAHYSGYQSTNDLLSINSLDGPTTSDEFIDHPVIRESNALKNTGAAIPQQRYTILRMSQLEDKFGNNNMRKSMKDSETEDPIVLFNRLPSKLDVSKIMFKIMSRKHFATASSIFIVVPISEDEEEQGSSNCVDSMNSLRSSECHFTANTTNLVHPGTMLQNKSEQLLRCMEMMKDEFCQISRPNNIAAMLENSVQGVGSDTTAYRPWCSSKDHHAVNDISRHITPLFLKGKSSSWFRLPVMRKAFAVCDVPPSCDFRFCSLAPSYSRYSGRSQQNHSKKQLLDDFKVTKNSSAKVGKSSSWFQLPGMRRFPASDIPPSCDFRFCPVPSTHSSNLGRGHQNHGKKNPLNDLKVTRNRSAKVQVVETATKNTAMSVSWFRLLRVREAPAASDTPTGDPSVFRHLKSVIKRNRLVKDLKPSAETIRYEGEIIHKITGVLKGLRWTRLSSKRKKSAPFIPTCGVPQYFDTSSSPMPPDYPHQRGRNQQNQTSTSPPHCVSKPAEFKVKRNISAKVQKPSINSIYHEDERTPKITGISRSGSRLACKRKTSVPSSLKATSSVPQYVDSSCSPVQPKHLHYHGRNDQNQTSATPSFCAYPKAKGIRTAKVQKPSIESMYHEGQTTSRIIGVSLSWSCLPSKSNTSVPLITTCGVQQYVESSCSPMPTNHARCHGRKEHRQTSAASSLCAYLPNDSKPKGNRSAKVQKPSIESLYHEGETTSKITGVTLSWSRIPRKRNTCPSITSSGLPQHPRLHCRNVQTETPESFFDYPSHDLKVMRNPSAKVQKLSIESTRQEDGTAPKKAGIVSGWFRLPGMRKTRDLNTPKNMELKSPKDPKNPETEMSAIKQKDPREIVKLPDSLDQAPAKLLKEIAPVQQQLANSKIVEQKEGELVREYKKAKPMSSQDLENPRTSKQKEKVTCKCEKHEPKKTPAIRQLPKPRSKRCPPQLPPAQLGLPPIVTPDGILYEGIGPSCKWLDTGEIKRLRSDLTRLTSGFKACKKKKLQKSQVVKPDNGIELDFADAIRYFASMNPERFQQLMQEELETQLKAEEDKRKEEEALEKHMEKVRKKSEKEAKKGKKNKTTTIDKFPISDESESDYPQGIKFSFVIKDGPTGLAGVDCSKMNRSW